MFKFFKKEKLREPIAKPFPYSVMVLVAALCDKHGFFCEINQRDIKGWWLKIQFIDHNGQRQYHLYKIDQAMPVMMGEKVEEAFINTEKYINNSKISHLKKLAYLGVGR